MQLMNQPGCPCCSTTYSCGSVLGIPATLNLAVNSTLFSATPTSVTLTYSVSLGRWVGQVVRSVVSASDCLGLGFATINTTFYYELRCTSGSLNITEYFQTGTSVHNRPVDDSCGNTGFVDSRLYGTPIYSASPPTLNFVSGNGIMIVTW